MAELLTLDNFFTLLMLILLQAVLGFDNLLYIIIESKRVTPEKQRMVRATGIGLAVFFRIILLFVITRAVTMFDEVIWTINWGTWVQGTINLHALIVLIGGAFIIYTAMKEISHMMLVDDLEHEGEGARRSVAGAIFLIVAMNVIFSFDSILSAMALTDVFLVMAAAIVISGILMIVLADHVAGFLQRNRMFEVLGLFILFIVGILLLSEGGHLAHLTLFGYAVEPMAKSTFYFVIFVMVIVDIVQTRYQRKLTARQQMAVDQRTGNA